MDGPTLQSTPEPPPPPIAPYRDGKALADIIPPDRRRAKTIVLVVASMAAGIALWLLGGAVLDAVALRRSTDVRSVPVTPGYVAGRISPGVLHGPGGNVTMPPPVRSVVHVWVQGCADCMPAFEAMRELEKNGGLGVRVPVINVAYGEADADWATRYGVRQNLVIDGEGGVVARPLGIGTFTTLVIDADGVILHRDRPDKPGYRERVRAAVGAENVEPDRKADPEDPLDDDPSRFAFDQAGVEHVVSAHRAAIKRTCWDRTASDAPRSAKISVSLRLGPDGHVTSTSSTGDDPALAKCIELQARTWRFPAPGYTITVNVPFKFVRE